MRMSRDTILNSEKEASCWEQRERGGLESLSWRLKCRAQKWYSAFQSQLTGQKRICGSIHHIAVREWTHLVPKTGGEKLYVTLKTSSVYPSDQQILVSLFILPAKCTDSLPGWENLDGVHPGTSGSSKVRMSEWCTVIATSGGGAHQWATVSQLELHLSTFHTMTLRCCKLYFVVYQLTHR